MVIFILKLRRSSFILGIDQHLLCLGAFGKPPSLDALFLMK